MDAYFELEGKLFQIFWVTLEDPQVCSVAKFVDPQIANYLCPLLGAAVGGSGTQFGIAKTSILLRRATIECMLQKPEPARLHREILANTHNPMSVVHPGSRRMFDSMRRTYCWPHMFIDINQWVEACVSCGRKCQVNKRLRYLQVFPTGNPRVFFGRTFQFFAKMLTGNRSVFVVADCYSKQTRGIPTKTTTAPQTATIFTDSCMLIHGIKKFLLAETVHNSSLNSLHKCASFYV